MKEYIVKTDDQNFSTTISEGVTLVDFYADLCDGGVMAGRH